MSDPSTEERNFLRRLQYRSSTSALLIDISDQMRLCCGGCPAPYRVFSRTLACTHQMSLAPPTLTPHSHSRDNWNSRWCLQTWLNVTSGSQFTPDKNHHCKRREVQSQSEISPHHFCNTPPCPRRQPASFLLSTYFAPTLFQFLSWMSGILGWQRLYPYPRRSYKLEGNVEELGNATVNAKKGGTDEIKGELKKINYWTQMDSVKVLSRVQEALSYCRQ